MLRKVLLLALIVFLAGCSQSLYNKGQQLSNEGQYDNAIDILYQEITVNPKNSKAWCELGVAFYKKGDLTKAEDALHQANSIKPDSKTNLFLGLIYEKQDKPNQAITAYRSALGMKPGSKTRKMLEGRLDNLIAQVIKKEVSFALSNESDIDADTIPNNSIAVVSFDNTHLSPELAPISKGLAEFTALDLAKVSSLKVVDRLKIDAILQELQLGKSGYVDPGTAPRFGRLIGSSKIITGTLVGLGDDVIRLDGAIVSIRDSITQMTSPEEASTEKFFQLQKGFVFKVIDNLGIQLTAEERDAIEEVPTESYLAFMAYCRGLELESQGMHQEAKREYGIAARNDVGFKQAKVRRNTAGRQAAAKAAPTTSFSQFETEVVSSETESAESSLDRFQTVALSTSGFILDTEYLDRYGSTLYSPLRTALSTGVIIIIKGDYDAAN
ncbi:MAG: tetratricopeptide repeat protein [candidate division Zixibacteria bacterium]|nr:tetratricopeptide repeat protein [candidate division Zixibacteria bacterium]